MPPQPWSDENYISRLERKSARDGDCIVYTGCISKKGYGWMSFRGKPDSVHRIKWILHNGPVPNGFEICHKCDNRSCFRLDHLFIGTHKDNMDDRDRKGRVKHNYWPVSGKAKLTDDQAREIYLIKGMNNSQIGRMYGVGHNIVRQIRIGKRRQNALKNLLKFTENA